MTTTPASWEVLREVATFLEGAEGFFNPPTEAQRKRLLEDISRLRASGECNKEALDDAMTELTHAIRSYDRSPDKYTLSEIAEAREKIHSIAALSRAPMDTREREAIAALREVQRTLGKVAPIMYKTDPALCEKAAETAYYAAENYLYKNGYLQLDRKRGLVECDPAPSSVVDADKLLREIDEYLSGHPQNAIYCGSNLHQDVKRAIAALSHAHSPATEFVWQPISTAPKDRDILVCYKNCDSWFVHNAFWLDGEGVDEEERGWWSYLITEVTRTKLDGCCEPTHWREQLAPPT